MEAKIRNCKRKDPTLYPLRQARLATICRHCWETIHPGEVYYDGGRMRWFHRHCAADESISRSETNMRYANLDGADLHDTDLRGANLRGTDLHDTEPWNAKLKERGR
jgi:hypothetical protein